MIPEPHGLNDVLKFHQLYNAFIGENPEIPSENVCNLRVNLLQEELDELKEAIANNDFVEVADALTDIQYVLSGAVISFGLHDKFKDLFDEVQRSNMSKACSTREVAEKTVAWYKEHKGFDGYIVEKDDVFIVLRKGDDKVLKSIEYSPAQLESIVYK